MLRFYSAGENLQLITVPLICLEVMNAFEKLKGGSLFLISLV